MAQNQTIRTLKSLWFLNVTAGHLKIFNQQKLNLAINITGIHLNHFWNTDWISFCDLGRKLISLSHLWFVCQTLFSYQQEEKALCPLLLLENSPMAPINVVISSYKITQCNKKKTLINYSEKLGIASFCIFGRAGFTFPHASRFSYRLYITKDQAVGLRTATLQSLTPVVFEMISRVQKEALWKKWAHYPKNL